MGDAGLVSFSFHHPTRFSIPIGLPSNGIISVVWALKPNWLVTPTTQEFVPASLREGVPARVPSAPTLSQSGPLILPKVSVELESDRKSTRLNSSHLGISYAVFCLK